MKQKNIAIALIGALLVTLVISTAIAEAYWPISSGANSAGVSIKISNGTATVTGDCTTLATGHTTKTTVYVQHLVGTNWVTIGSSSGGQSAQVSHSVESGEFYRGRVVGKVYNSAGTQVDELSCNTDGKQAP